MVDEVAERLRAAYATGSAEAMGRDRPAGREAIRSIERRGSAATPPDGRASSSIWITSP
jgi:hypothetical protein